MQYWITLKQQIFLTYIIKMNRHIFLFILLFVQFGCSSQKFIGLYSYKNRDQKINLEIKPNGTFYWKEVTLGTMITYEGKWHSNNNSIQLVCDTLKDYEFLSPGGYLNEHRIYLEYKNRHLYKKSNNKLRLKKQNGR